MYLWHFPLFFWHGYIFLFYFIDITSLGVVPKLLQIERDTSINRVMKLDLDGYHSLEYILFCVCVRATIMIHLCVHILRGHICLCLQDRERIFLIVQLVL